MEGEKQARTRSYPFLVHQESIETVLETYVNSTEIAYVFSNWRRKLPTTPDYTSK
jgi:hypothetical protein